jgi:hypothetical protein
MFTDLIRDIEARTRKPRVIECKDLPSGFILLDKGDGVPEILTLPAYHRCYTADSLQGVVAQVEYLHAEAGDDKGEEGATSTTVFVGSRITVCLDERGSRRDRCAMQLENSEQFDSLESLQGERPMSQKELIWMLTSRFRDNILTTDFLPTIRNIKFKSSSEGTARVQHGDESLGASIETEAVTGKDGGTLPDMVEFEVPVFEFLDITVAPTAKIRCAVKFNIQEKTIVVRPEPGQLAIARAKAIQEIAEYLSKSVPQGVIVLLDSTFGTR